MKKTISLSLVFSFLMALAIQMPALATDTSTSTPPIMPTYPTPPAPTSTPSYVPPTYPTPPAPTSSSTPLTSSSTPTYIPPMPVASSTPTIEPVAPTQATGTTPELISTSTQPVKIDASATDKNLEKILSPDQIKLYEKVTKIGNSLYGVKKITSTSTVKATAQPATSATANLEKILSPDQIKLYEKVTKIGNSLYGIKKKVAAAVNPVKTNNYVLPDMSSDLITCASTAIDTKDSSISAAVTQSATDIAAAITERGTCQKAALQLTSERQGALNKCNQTFAAAAKTANEKVKSAQKDLWTSYTSDLKTCASAAKSTDLIIEDGGQNTTDALAQ